MNKNVITDTEEIDLKEYLKKWDCLNLKCTAMILDLVETLGYEVHNWKVKSDKPKQ